MLSVLDDLNPCRSGILCQKKGAHDHHYPKALIFTPKTHVNVGCRSAWILGHRRNFKRPVMFGQLLTNPGTEVPKFSPVMGHRWLKNAAI